MDESIPAVSSRHQSENADKIRYLDSYANADNAYNSRYKKTRRSYAFVRKTCKPHGRE